MKCTNTLSGDGAFFCETSLPFCFILPGSESFLVYSIFRVPTQCSWSHVPICIMLGHASYLACHSRILRGIYAEECHVLFTLGNRWKSCHAPLATYAAFPLGHRPLYCRKQVESFLVYPIFRMPTQSSWSHVPICIMLGHASYLACHSRILRGIYAEECHVLFTLGNRWKSCHASLVTYAAFLLGHRPLYCRKQVEILLCHPLNLRGISTGISSCFLK